MYAEVENAVYTGRKFDSWLENTLFRPVSPMRIYIRSWNRICERGRRWSTYSTFCLRSAAGTADGTVVQSPHNPVQNAIWTRSLPIRSRVNSMSRQFVQVRSLFFLTITSSTELLAFHFYCFYELCSFCSALKAVISLELQKFLKATFKISYIEIIFVCLVRNQHVDDKVAHPRPHQQLKTNQNDAISANQSSGLHLFSKLLCIPSAYRYQREYDVICNSYWYK